jgi:hypothetical protein
MAAESLKASVGQRIRAEHDNLIGPSAEDS